MTNTFSDQFNIRENLISIYLFMTIVHIIPKVVSSVFLDTKKKRTGSNLLEILTNVLQNILKLCITSRVCPPVCMLESVELH